MTVRQSPTALPIAPPGSRWTVRRMRAGDLDAVMDVERAIYPHPWSRGNFLDSLDSGYDAWVFDADGVMVGYAVLMWLPDEIHLLNISVAAPAQGAGLGRSMLEALCDDARRRGAGSMLLEVRPSNEIARSLYVSCGFAQIGLRKRYYPAAHGMREDALVMRRDLSAADMARKTA